MTEFVTNEQWDAYARRIENKNLREKGRSLTCGGIARRANPFIVEIRMDEGGMIVKEGWRQAMREASL